MEEPFSRQDKAKVSLNKRICYVLTFLAIVLPVVTGVVVWHLTQSSCESSDGGSGADGGSQDSQVGGTTCPTVPAVTSPPAEATTTVISEDEPWKNLRLPKYVIPIHYDITLYPNFYGDNGWFYGNETAELNVTQPTKVILIHANYMEITRTKLTYSNAEDIPIADTFWYEPNQFWVVLTVSPVEPSLVNLELQFDGSLTRAIVGFYKSTYTNSITGEVRYTVSVVKVKILKVKWKLFKVHVLFITHSIIIIYACRIFCKKVMLQGR